MGLTDSGPLPEVVFVHTPNAAAYRRGFEAALAQVVAFMRERADALASEDLDVDHLVDLADEIESLEPNE